MGDHKGGLESVRSVVESKQNAKESGRSTKGIRLAKVKIAVNFAT